MPSCVQQQQLLECLTYNSAGTLCTSWNIHDAYVDILPQPLTYTSCTNVLAQVSELSYFPQLTLLQGSLIATAIISIWAIAFAWRAAKRAM